MKIKRMKILTSALNEIRKTIGALPCEKGGLLLGREEDYVISKFVFDKHAKTSSVTYTFNVEYLNTVVKQLWDEEKLSVIGFIHSHPVGCNRPSIPDMRYFKDQFSHMPRRLFYTPIVCSQADSLYKIYPFILYNKADDVMPVELEEISDQKYYEELRNTKVEQKSISKIENDSYKNNSIKATEVITVIESTEQVACQDELNNKSKETNDRKNYQEEQEEAHQPNNNTSNGEDSKKKSLL